MRGAPDYQPWTAFQRFEKTGGAALYEQTFTVPPNTAEGLAITDDFILEKGFIIHGTFRFPPGPMGLLRAALYNGATRLYPPIAGTWFSGNDESVDFWTEYDVPLVGSDYKLTLKGWNGDDTYAHGVIVRIFLVRIP
jgi:hypothetical protein